MFEIRVICDTADTHRITAALSGTFTAGPVRSRATRDRSRTRLYLTADHRPEPSADGIDPLTWVTAPCTTECVCFGRGWRLYVDSDDGMACIRPCTGPTAPEMWPTPETAYANAPSLTSEIAWVARTARNFEGLADRREFWLRKAAVFDRVALAEQERAFVIAGTAEPDADLTAEATAVALINDDGAEPDTNDPRDYVRREYARWLESQ